MYSSDSRLNVCITDGHTLHQVLSATLVHLRQLPVLRELVGDLPHSGHPCVDELDGKVSIFVVYYMGFRCRS